MLGKGAADVQGVPETGNEAVATRAGFTPQGSPQGDVQEKERGKRNFFGREGRVHLYNVSRVDTWLSRQLMYGQHGDI